MPKKQFANQKRPESGTIRDDIRKALYERFFNLWLNKYESEGMERDEREWLLRQLWTKGSVIAFRLKDMNEEFLGGEATQYASPVGFANYTTSMWNIYERPIVVYAMNELGSPYIPTNELVNHVDCCIISATHDLRPLADVIDPILSKLVDIEMVVRTNLKSLKVPLMVVTTSDTKDQVRQFTEAYQADEPIIYTSVDMGENISYAPNGTPYVIDKLYQYKKDTENELLTYLGINNTPFEKAERLVVDEVNSNNQMVRESGSVMDDCIAEGFEELNSLFGTNMSLRPKSRDAMNPLGADPKEDENDEKAI